MDIERGPRTATEVERKMEETRIFLKKKGCLEDKYNSELLNYKTRKMHRVGSGMFCYGVYFKCIDTTDYKKCLKKKFKHDVH